MLPLPGSFARGACLIIRSWIWPFGLDIFVAGPDIHLFVLAMPRSHTEWLESDYLFLRWLVDGFPSFYL